MSNHKKTHAPEDLMLYAAYEPARAAVRPRYCSNGDHCWVRRGPPCWVKIKGHISGCCAECQDIPPQVILGFTGTQRGLTLAQQSALANLAALPDLVLHGGATGADQQFSDWLVAKDPAGNCQVEIYPASDDSRCLWLARARIRPWWQVHAVQPPLNRNRVIAERCERLLACPAEIDEQARGGTWYTVRRARELRRPVTIILPDGTFLEEPGR